MTEPRTVEYEILQLVRQDVRDLKRDISAMRRELSDGAIDIALLKFKLALLGVAAGAVGSALVHWLGKLFFSVE